MLKKSKKVKKELQRKESIKIKCPSCKDVIPSNASRCSHCTADLSGEKSQSDIEQQLEARRGSKLYLKVAIVASVFIVIMSMLVAMGDDDGGTTQTPKESMKVKIGDVGLGNEYDPYSAYLLIENNNSFNWQDCDLELNGAYRAHMEVISVNSQENKISFTRFAKKGGEFFDISKYTFTEFEAKCKKPYFGISGYKTK